MEIITIDFNGSSNLEKQKISISPRAVVSVVICQEKNIGKCPKREEMVLILFVGWLLSINLTNYRNCSDLLWEKKCSSDREKLLKFEAEGRELAKFLRSLEQFIQTVKGQNNFW